MDHKSYKTLRHKFGGGFFVMTVLLFGFSINIFASTIILKSGEKVEGNILEQTKKYIKVDSGVGVGVTYYTDEIDTIDGQKLQTAAPHPEVQQPTLAPVQSHGETAKPVKSESEDISQVEELINKENYDSALSILNKLVENGSNNSWVYSYRAVCLEHKQDYDGALRDYFNVIKLDPELGKKNYKRMGFVYLAKRNGAQAESWFDNYLTSFPDDAETYYGLAVARYDIGDSTSALEYLNKAQSLGYNQDVEEFKQRILSAQQEREARYQAQRHGYSSSSYSSGSNSNKDIGYAFFGFVFGIGLFFNGLKALRKKAIIESIPNSTVRGLALGMVELNGKAKKTCELVSPLTETECTFYKYTVERHEGSGKSSRWVMISQGDSVLYPFCLQDDTGQIMVLPKGAELVMPVDFTYTGSALSDNLVNFMEKNKIQYKGFFGVSLLRFNEWYIRPDEPVFVLGTAQKNTQQMSNGIDENMQQGPDGNDVVITKGDNKQIFIVSDESQTQVVKGFSWQAFCGIWGGPALTLTTLAYLLFRFNIWGRF